MITLTCECCNISEDFIDLEKAFDKGWDAPPHFTGYICCDLCPAAFIMLGQKWKHIPIHKKWEKEGRPLEFSQETCVPLEDQASEEEMNKLQKFLEGFMEEPWDVEVK